MKTKVAVIVALVVGSCFVCSIGAAALKAADRGAGNDAPTRPTKTGDGALVEAGGGVAAVPPSSDAGHDDEPCSAGVAAVKLQSRDPKSVYGQLVLDVGVGVVRSQGIVVVSNQWNLLSAAEKLSIANELYEPFRQLSPKCTFVIWDRDSNRLAIGRRNSGVSLVD